MPWWSWIVIWAGLVLVLIGMFAWFAWKLFKKLLAVLTELEALAASAEVLSGVPAARSDQLRRSALFMNMAEIRARRESEMTKRADRVDARMQRRLMRGKLLIHADYREFLHLTKRT